MLKSAILSILLFVFLFSFSQQWEKVDQSYYGMKYEFPKGSEIDGFGWDNDWETTGSAVCDCSGTINIVNYWQEDEVYMVVYPTMFKDSLNATKRKMVWDMTFKATGPQDLLTSEYCQFTRKVGKWNDPGEVKHYEGNIVWQMKTKKFGQYYMLYFWAKPDVFKENENLIAHVIASFQPVKRTK